MRATPVNSVTGIKVYGKDAAVELVFFFKDSPFAWNGLLAWWLFLLDFFSWVVVTTVLVLRNLCEQNAQASSSRCDLWVQLSPTGGRPASIASRPALK